MTIDPKWTVEQLVELNLTLQQKLGEAESALGWCAEGSNLNLKERIEAQDVLRAVQPYADRLPDEVHRAVDAQLRASDNVSAL